MKRKIIVLSSILLLSFFLSACSFPGKSKKLEKPNDAVNTDLLEQENMTDGPVLSSGNLKKFKDYNELQDFLLSINLDLAQSDSIDKANRSSDFKKASQLGFNANSEDIIRREGDYVYALVYNDLYVIKVSPVEQARALTKLSFPDRPSAIYISNNKLIVLGADSQIMSSSVYKNFKRQSPYTFVKIFDITKPEEAKQIRDLNFEGSHLDSRLVAGQLYLFINNYFEHNIAEPLNPRLVDNGKILTSSCETGKKCFAPDVYYFDAPYNSYRLVSVNGIDLSADNMSVLSQAYLLNDKQGLYLANDNFYISYSQSLNELELEAAVLRDLLFNRLNTPEKTAVMNVENLSNNILTSLEKNQKIYNIFNTYINSLNHSDRVILDKEIKQALADRYKQEAGNLEKSLLYRFSLSKGAPVFRAQGEVLGLVLPESALHENKESNLQVITKSSDFSSPTATERQFHHNLYTLNSDLKLVSFLEKFSSNQKFSAVNFSGDMALIWGLDRGEVSILNLNKPQAPKFVGKFQLPSDYSFLRPYNEETLIAFGPATEKDQYNNLKNIGLKLSLLDLSSSNNLQELDTYVLGSSNSKSILFDSEKPLLFSLDKNILSVPAALTSLGQSQHPNFSGSVVFKIDNNKFSFIGQIDHSDGGKYQLADSWCGKNCFDNSVQRSFYIADNLYTFSNKYLKINRLNDISPVQAIKLIADTEVDLNFSLPSKDLSPELEPDSGDLKPIGPNLEPNQNTGSDSDEKPDESEQTEPEPTADPAANETYDDSLPTEDNLESET